MDERNKWRAASTDSKSILNGTLNAKINQLYQCQLNMCSSLSKGALLRHIRVGVASRSGSKYVVGRIGWTGLVVN